MKTLVISCLLAAVAWAQPPDSLWSRVLGASLNSRYYDMVETSDGGIAVAGYQDRPANNYDLWLVKYDRFGNFGWQRLYGGSNAESCFALIETIQHGFALGSYTRTLGSGESDFWLYRTDSVGTALDHDTYGGSQAEFCESVYQFSGQGFFLAGWTYSFGAGDADGWMVITNQNGDSMWSQTYGGTGDDRFYDALFTSDGNFMYGGHTDSFGHGSGDMWLLKTNEDGDSLWSKTFGGSGSENCSKILETDDGNFILAGHTSSYGAGGTDFWLVKTNGNGDSLWSHTYGGHYNEDCMAITACADGGYALAGWTESFGAGDADFWVVKTDADGDSMWSMTLGGDAADHCNAIIQTSDGGFALAGDAHSFSASHFDGWLVKIGPPFSQELTIQIQSVQGQQRVILRWIVPETGDYEIYSTTNPNLFTDPPDAGWDLETTLFGLQPGNAIWIDGDALQSSTEQRRYVVNRIE